MGALTIAFDITIVGALGLPWVVLAVHLFLFESENRLGDVLDWVKKQEQQAAAAVLLFAVAYTMGSAVSRIAQDFFNDDDLFLPVGHRLLRMGMTENRILTSVYCKRDANSLLLAGAGNPALAAKIYTFQWQKSKDCREKDAGAPVTRTEKPALREGVSASPPQKPDCLCWHALSWYIGPGINADDDELNGTAADIFNLQESALLLKGQDATQRLHQLHDQIMVLRGAAFNGVIAFSLCLFAWGVRVSRDKPRSVLRWVLALVPGVFLSVAAITFWHHFSERSSTDPPYMEFSLLLMGLTGAWLLWIPRPQPPDAKKARSGSSATWAVVTLLSFVLTVTATLGWWATEVAYAQEVIYSYDSQWVTTAKN
jgi:hypothetical protein